VQGDPTEGALIVAARKAGLEDETLARRLPRVGEVPFSAERKLMTTVHHDAERRQRVVFTKGAPDVLLTRCSFELVGGDARSRSCRTTMRWPARRCGRWESPCAGFPGTRRQARMAAPTTASSASSRSPA
jgi:magnesium-transporting ATPase (P-type)